LLLSIARHDCLPLILESDTDSVLFVCAGECDFRVRELVLEVYWRGFASIPVEDRLAVLDSDAFLMMVCGPVLPDMTTAALECLDEICRHSESHGYTFSNETREAMQEFVTGFLDTDDDQFAAQLLEFLQ
jgi:hypothetical protein